MTVSAAPGGLLLPIGHLLGAFYRELGSTAHTVQLRVGPESVPLDELHLTAWALAHGMPGRSAEEPWTRQALQAAAAAQGIGDLTGAVDALLADRLLVEVPPTGPAAVAFARDHRLLPLTLGLGNSATEPDVWTVGLVGTPLAEMASWMYDLFEWAHLYPDLWAACEASARTAQRAGRTEPREIDPTALLTSVLQNLHQLLTVDAVCLDTRLARP